MDSEKPNLRCPYCKKEGFTEFDAVSFHVYGLTSEGDPSCPDIGIESIKRMEGKFFSEDPLDYAGGTTKKQYKLGNVRYDSEGNRLGS